MKHAHAAAALAAASIMAGCAALPDTQDQVVYLRTSPPVPSTHCTLANSQGAWDAWSTPYAISILRDSKPLVVECKSPLGLHGSIVVRSHPDAAAGLVGSGSDSVAETSDALPPQGAYLGNTSNKWNGAFRQYPGTITVRMIPDRY